MSDEGCVQGAAEIVLRRCVSVMDDTGSVAPLADEMRAKLEETVTNMASTGLRTLCLTMRDMDESMAGGNEEFWENVPDEELTLCCIVGIKVRRCYPCKRMLRGQSPLAVVGLLGPRTWRVRLVSSA